MVALAERRPTDEQLSELTAAGDAEAFAALYDRYFQGVYDFVFRVVRDGDAVPEVIGQGFASAWAAMRRRHVENVRARVYVAVYAAAVERARRVRAVSGAERAGDDGVPNFTGLDTNRLADPAAVLRDAELVRLVWEGAASLGAAEYGLLDLQLRKGLPLAELAAELRIKQRTLEARLARLKDALVRSVAAARGESAPTRVSPLAVFASLALLAVPPGLQEAVWPRVVEQTRRPPAPRWKAKKTVVALAALAVLAAATAGVILALRGGGPHDPTSFQSTTHQIGAETSDATITISWTPEPNATGYSILWSAEPALPDETVDLAGDKAGTARVVTPGQWWFNLRTRDANGDWTHTVHIGPYVVIPVPNTRIASRPSELSNDDHPIFRLEASGEGTFECSLDGGQFQHCGARTAIGRIPDGRHRLQARVRDRYGNADATPAVWVWRLDTKAPRTRIDSAAFDDDKAFFRFSANERRAVFECRMDEGEFTRCRSPLSVDDLPEGDHLLVVRATDRAGNRDGSPAIRRWTVDTKRPKTRIVSGPSGVVHRTKATFGVDSNEDEVTYECSLDGRAYQACAANVAYVGLEAGEHTFLARARDEAGNVDSTPARRRWTVVDSSRPDTTITEHPRVSSRDTSPTFTFRSSEPGSSFECRLDAGAWRSCSSPKTYHGLANGSHVFRVRARDASGNADRTPASWSWTIHGGRKRR
jgi:DNA-directed RNA polymerase specialized sigma24 family protein